MSLFKDKEYKRIFDESTENYDPDEDYDDEEEEIEEDIKAYWGTIDKGDCIYCGAKNAMKNYDEVCFICDKCKNSIDYKGYLIWASGHQITFEDFS